MNAMSRSLSNSLCGLTLLVGVAVARGQDVVVEAVDAEGAPVAGVPVVLRVSPFGGSALSIDCVRATTDASGRAVFSDVDDVRRGTPLPVPVELPESERWREVGWRLQIDSVPIASGAFVTLGRELPTEVVRLSTANLAELHVVAVDSTGAPTDDSTEVLVMSAESSTSATPLRMSISETDSSRGVALLDFVRRPLVSGEATLPWIGVDDGVAVFVRRNALSDWSGVHWKQQDGDERNRVEVELAAGLRTFVLRPTQVGQGASLSSLRARRTVREDEAAAFESVPLERRAVVSEGWTEGTGLSVCPATWTPFESFQHGAVGEVVFDATPSGLTHLDLAQVAARTEDGVERCAIVALASLSAEPRVVAPAPLGARVEPLSGVVVDALGAPLSGALLLLEESYWSYTFAFDRPSLLRLAHTTTDSLGRFSLPYPPAKGRRIVLSAPGCFLQASPAADEAVLRIVAERIQSLRGYIRVSDPDAARDLNILLLRADGSSASAQPGLTVGCSCDGVFQFDRVAPGRHTLIVRRVRDRQPPLELFRRENILLSEGGVTDIGEIAIQ